MANYSKKREDIIDTGDIAVTDVKEGVATARADAGGVDPEAVIAKINKEFPALPVEVVKNQLNVNDIFKVNMPEPYNKMFAYSWPSKDGQDLAECLSMNYRIDLPREVYEANMGASDAPYAASKAQGNRIIRGDNILAICRVEDAMARHEERRKKIAEKYRPTNTKDRIEGHASEITVSNKRDIRAEMAMRDSAASRLMEQENRSK